METYWVTFAFVSPFRLFVAQRVWMLGSEGGFLRLAKAAGWGKLGPGHLATTAALWLSPVKTALIFGKELYKSTHPPQSCQPKPSAHLKIEAAIGHLLVTVQIWNGYFCPSVHIFLFSPQSLFSVASMYCRLRRCECPHAVKCGLYVTQHIQGWLVSAVSLRRSEVIEALPSI